MRHYHPPPFSGSHHDWVVYTCVAIYIALEFVKLAAVLSKIWRD